MSAFLYSYIGYIMAAALFYMGVKSLWVSYITQRTKYRLYALRDRVRMSGIMHRRDQNFAYSYLDFSISKSISRLGSINIWVILVYGFRHRNDTYMQLRIAEIQNAISLNSECIAHQEQYNDLMTEYLYQKSFISYRAIRGTLHCLIMVIEGANNISNRLVAIDQTRSSLTRIYGLVERATLVPEMSVSDDLPPNLIPEYCPA